MNQYNWRCYLATDEERRELAASAAEIKENWKKLTAGTHALYTADETHREVSQHLGEQEVFEFREDFRDPISYPKLQVLGH